MDNSGALLTTLIGAGLGGAAFFGLAMLLGIDEARIVPRMLLRRR